MYLCCWPACEKPGRIIGHANCCQPASCSLPSPTAHDHSSTHTHQLDLPQQWAPTSSTSRTHLSESCGPTSLCPRSSSFSVQPRTGLVDLVNTLLSSQKFPHSRESGGVQGHAQESRTQPYNHSRLKPSTSIFCTTALYRLVLLQVLVWLGLGSYLFTINAKVQDKVIPIVTAITWLYTSLRPITWPSQTVFFDLFALYLAHLMTELIRFGGLFFDHSVYQLPLPSHLALAARVVNLSVIAISLVIVLNMPFAVPSATINKDNVGKTVSPEDYCSLWDWISFHWVVPLIKKGTYNTLNEDDVWKLSPTLSSRPLTSLFNDLGHASIVWKLWTANSSDMIWDFFLTLISVTLTYAGPFFLQRILAAIDSPTPDDRAKAYICTFAAFSTTLLKVVSGPRVLLGFRRVKVGTRTQGGNVPARAYVQLPLR